MSNDVREELPERSLHLKHYLCPWYRPRLIQLLNEGLYTNRKLSLISAPAEIEKITQVVAWLKQIDPPVAWLTK